MRKVNIESTKRYELRAINSDGLFRNKNLDITFKTTEVNNDTPYHKTHDSHSAQNRAEKNNNSILLIKISSIIVIFILIAGIVHLNGF
ncbi:MAG: hypothetical protein IPO25_12880 [Saprospiraceae bacterium]|nr:hypothetical protein [Saprospiraceae bacterium]